MLQGVVHLEWQVGEGAAVLFLLERVKGDFTAQMHFWMLVKARKLLLVRDLINSIGLVFRGGPAVFILLERSGGRLLLNELLLNLIHV